MKKLLSLLLTLVMVITACAVFPLSAAAEAGFEAGDVLRLKIESPAAWADRATLYANFTDASREDNGGASVTLDGADPKLYRPVTGLSFDRMSGTYRYTVTEDDAGAAAMRFWRGDSTKLWNSSVVLTAEDYSKGLNTVVVTDWEDSGYLTVSYDFDLKASVSAAARADGAYDIKATYTAPEGAKVSCAISIDDEKVSDSAEYTFKPSGDGVYTISAELVALDADSGRLMSRDSAETAVIVGTSAVRALTSGGLYAHAARGSKDRDGWVKWYEIDGVCYLFLPNSLREGEEIELFNAYHRDATLDSVKIPANGIADFRAKAGEEYKFGMGDVTRSVKFMYSNAESALFINNTDDFDGMDFFSYLKSDKSNSVSAYGALTTSGGVVSADIKKLKGRGNTSWNADKKGFNVTFNDNVEIAGMDKGKKFSLVSNFQDAAMARNRILFDLSDAVGVPYASDSRMIDLYTNGIYQGTYQICQKIETGKNTMMDDIDDKEYLDKDTGLVRDDFSFVAEIDPNPSEDDFHFSTQYLGNLTVKAPELDGDDPNLATVRGYIRGKVNTMFDKLNSRAADIADYIDIDSFAKVYLINELGKNWDSGASSFFMTYKKDAKGSYKFFASPVWDYDNSLGNANGVENDLRRMGITDYTLPTGWFATKKGGYSGSNILATAARHPDVMRRVYEVWFEDFVPALDALNGVSEHSDEILTAEEYRKIIKASAGMNYMVWPLVTNTSWIADHSSLQRWGVSYTYGEDGKIIGASAMPYRSITEYDQYSYDGQFDYMMDWLNSRAAWISGEYISNYAPVPPAEEPTTAENITGDVNLNGEVDILDATLIQRYLASLDELSPRQLSLADACGDGEVDILDATRIQRYLAGYVKSLR